jgi:hypothetical protein
MWLSFTADYDFSPEAKAGRVTLAYKAGMTANVTRECADKAIAAGKAVRTISPQAKEADHAEE